MVYLVLSYTSDQEQHCLGHTGHEDQGSSVAVVEQQWMSSCQGGQTLLCNATLQAAWTSSPLYPGPPAVLPVVLR